MPVDIRRRRLRDVDQTNPGENTDLDISDNGNSDENKSALVDPKSDADITFAKSDGTKSSVDDILKDSALKVKDDGSIDLNSSRLVDIVLSAKNSKNPPKVLLDDAVTKDKFTTDTSTAQHTIRHVTTADLSSIQNDNSLVTANPGDHSISDESTTHSEPEGNNPIQSPDHSQQLDSLQNPQQQQLQQLPDLESRGSLSKTELPYLNERLLTTDSLSQSTGGQEYPSRGQKLSTKGQDISSKGQEVTSTISSLVKRTSEAIGEPLLESSTDSTSTGSSSIGSTSTGNFPNGSTSTTGIPISSASTESSIIINDALADSYDNKDQDSSSDNVKDIVEKTVDSDKSSEVGDTSDSSIANDSTNNLEKNLLTSTINGVVLDDEMSLEGGKNSFKSGELNDMLKDNDNNATLKIDLVASGKKLEDSQNLETEDSADKEDYDYSYYGDLLDFGDSSDDYIGEGERLAKMIEQPAEALPDEDYYEYNYEDGTIKIPFNYSGLQSTGLSSMPRSWDAKVAFLEQVGMRLYMFIPAMMGGVLLGLMVWLFTIFIIRSYGTVKVKIFGQNKESEQYKLEKIDKDSLPVRGDQRRDSDRRKQRVAGGDLFTSFNEKSPPPATVHSSVVPCYIPEPDYGHDNDAYMNTEELNNKDDISPFHLHNSKDDILCHNLNNNKQEKSAKILDVHYSADYSLGSQTDIIGVDEEVHSVQSLKSATSSSSGIGNSEKGSLDLSETKSSVTNDISLLDDHQLSINQSAVGGQTGSLKDVELNKDSVNLNRRKSD